MLNFPDEESCEIFLKTYHENSGIYCKTCKCFSKQYWYSGSKFFEFSKCRRRTSLKVWTVMESSNLSLHIWFTTFLFMSATKKWLFLPWISETVSVEKIWGRIQSHAQDQCDNGQKRRSVPAQRDGGIPWSACGKATKKVVQEQLKQWKESQKQAIITVASESTPLEDPKSGKKSSHWGFLKLKVLVDVTRGSVEEFVKKSIDSKPVLFTDKYTAYLNLEKMMEQHIKVKSTSESANGPLNWAHIAISNLKKDLICGFNEWSVINISRFT